MQAKKVPGLELERFCSVTPSGLLMPRVHPKLIDYMVRQELPCNARDLLGILDRSIAVSPGNELRLPPVSDRPMPVSEQVPRTRPSGAPASAKAEPEDEAALAERVRGLLERMQWNVSKVAEAIGMDRSTLRRLMTRHGIAKEGTVP